MYSTGSVMVQIFHGVDLGFLKHVIVYWGVSMHTEVHRAPVITPSASGLSGPLLIVENAVLVPMTFLAQKVSLMISTDAKRFAE